jgi:alkylation response protein AidB-like acyl-CoA dehydrogenase
MDTLDTTRGSMTTDSDHRTDAPTTAPTAGTDDLGEFRERARTWLAAEMRPASEGLPRHHPDRFTRAKLLQRKLWEAGFAGICYPKQYGGQGLPPEFQRAFNEEAAAFEMPLAFNTPTLTIILPTILDFGTEEQKREFIPRTLRGDLLWVQLLSEPTNGSDLAGALTRADRDGDAWVLNGSKIWSTSAAHTDFGLCLARTNWDAPKHRGLSVFIVAIHQDGVDVQPIKQVDGSDEFYQEFFDDVVLTSDALLGAENDGWTVTSRLLFHERSAVGGASPYASGRDHVESVTGDEVLIDLALRTGRNADPHVRQLVAEGRVLSRVHEDLIARLGAQMTAGTVPPVAGSMPRLMTGTNHNRLSAIALEIAGTSAVAGPAAGGFAEIATTYLARQGMSLGGGSNEMQRNIISERVLGMPRDRGADTDLPFTQVRHN